MVDENLSIADGCIRPFQRSMSSSWYRAIMAQTALHYGYDPTVPFKEWDEEGKNIILNGTGSTNIDFNILGRKG